MYPTDTSITLETQLKTFSVGCCYCCTSSLVIFTFCNKVVFLCFSAFTVSPADYIYFWNCLEFCASVIHARAWVTPAATLDLCYRSDAYPRGLPMQASTSCQDTGRRTWRLPCWSWLSYLHLSVETRSTFFYTVKCNKQASLPSSADFCVFRQHNFLWLVSYMWPLDTVMILKAMLNPHLTLTITLLLLR